MAIVAILTLWLGVTAWLWHMAQRGRISSRYARESAALWFLALATTAFFWRLILVPDTWMPVGGGDLVSFLYPMYRFMARSLASGDLPLWNPHLYGGAPFAADNQSGLFYPLNLALVMLQPDLSYRMLELFAALQYFLAGAAMYAGLRWIERRPVSRPAALAAALTFMFSDLFITHFGNLNMVTAAAWLPLVFFPFRRALAEQRLGWAVVAGVFLGIAALAGHIQPLLHMTLAVGLYWVYHMGSHWRCGLRSLVDRCAVPLVVMVTAVGLSAPVLLPGYEMARWSVRTDLSYQQASEYSLPPEGLVGILVPAYHGRGPRGFWGPWPRVEVGYVGIAPLLLALFAVFLRRDRLARFAFLLAILATLLALGNHTPLHGWFYRWVPGMDMLRAPARTIYLLDFALALLTALGLDAVIAPAGQRPGVARLVARVAPWLVAVVVAGALWSAYQALAIRPDDEQLAARLLARGQGILFAVAVLLACVMLAVVGRRTAVRRPLLALAFCGIIFVDLYVQGAHTELETNDPTVGFNHSEVVAFLNNDPDTYRIDTRTGIAGVWQPDLSLMVGIDDVAGIYNPLVLADYDRYWEGLGSRSTPLYDFLNVKYLVGLKDVVLDWDKFELAFDGDPQVNVYRNIRDLPRAALIHHAQVAETHDHAFELIQREEFDPATMVVIEDGPALAAAGTSSTSTARIVSYANDELTIETNAGAAGYLVLSEVYYPGWHATVDGEPVQVHRANYAFRAVLVPAGSHTVHVYFRPRLWIIGMLWAALTCAVVGIVATSRIVTIWKRRRLTDAVAQT